MEARLQKRWVDDLGLGDRAIPKNLDECKWLRDNLEQYDPKAARLPTQEEYEQEKGLSLVPEVIDQRNEGDPEAGPGPSTQAHREELKLLQDLGLIANEEIEQDGYFNCETKKIEKSERFISLSASSYWKPPEEDIYFEEARVGDPERPHRNLFLLTKWKAIVPLRENPAYAFNGLIGDQKKYAEALYMPQLMADARGKISDVIKLELQRKDQIKSAIVVFCSYIRQTSGDRKKGINPETHYMQKHHRGTIRPILSEQYIDEHLDLSVGEIDIKIEGMLEGGSGWKLIRIEMVFIEAYTLHRATGGSFIPTPKKLANTKCTINPDNHVLIDPETNRPSEKCLQGALDAYFAYQDGHTENLNRIFRAKKLKPYLDIVK
jgi:hypothetical protein